MFLEVNTVRDERVLLNVKQILFVTVSKRGAVIFDVSGNSFYVKEGYEEIVERLNSFNKEIKKRDKTYKTYKTR